MPIVTPFDTKDEIQGGFREDDHVKESRLLNILKMSVGVV
jgi:hypothetical protein